MSDSCAAAFCFLKTRRTEENFRSSRDLTNAYRSSLLHTAKDCQSGKLKRGMSNVPTCRPFTDKNVHKTDHPPSWTQVSHSELNAVQGSHAIGVACLHHSQNQGLVEPAVERSCLYVYLQILLMAEESAFLVMEEMIVCG